MDEEGEGAKETPRCETESAARRSVRIYGQTVQTGRQTEGQRGRLRERDPDWNLGQTVGMDKVFF